MFKRSYPIKWASCTRVLPDKPEIWGSAEARLTRLTEAPRRNDVLIARVLEINCHSHLELACGRRATLFEDDLVGVAMGNRYATVQFEAIVPNEILETYDLLSIGGVCGVVIGRPGSMDEPTRLAPIGVLTNGDGEVVNLQNYGLSHRSSPVPQNVTTIVVVGSSMDAGKTTTAAALVRGLFRAGMRVGAGKLTGTAASKDVDLMRDAGAVHTLDFTHVGHAATAGCEASELQDLYGIIWGHLAAAQVDYIVLEIADGIVQRETRMLLDWLSLTGQNVKLLCAVGDALSVAGAVSMLSQLNLELIGISGRVTMSSLGTKEAAAISDYPVWRVEQLSDPMIRTMIETALPCAISI